MNTKMTKNLKSSLLKASVITSMALTALTANAEYSVVQDQIISPNNDHIEIANLYFQNGNLIKFVMTPDTGEIYLGEIIPISDNEANYLTDELLEKSPKEIFQALTPNYVAVPKLLLQPNKALPKSSTDGVLLIKNSADLVLKKKIEERQTTDRLNQDIYVIASEISAAPIVTLAATGGSCGNQGAAYFTENHCGTIGSGGYGKAHSHCDAGLSSWIQRTSHKAMRLTYTRMATCGTTGVLKHSRNTLSGFKTHFTYNQPSNFVSKWTTKKSGLAWKRRARFERSSNSGGVRGWTHFFKQLTF